MGRTLITIGLLLVGAGVLLQLGLPLGRLPGDIVIKRGSGTFYFPVVTCLVVSAILTLVTWVFRR